MYYPLVGFLCAPLCTCVHTRGLPSPGAAAGGDITGSFPSGQGAAGQTDLETPLTLLAAGPLAGGVSLRVSSSEGVR